MTYKAEDYINRAEDPLMSAKILLQNELIAGTLNRSYYCVFYCVQLLLLSEGHFFKTHSGLKGKFSELFIKTGKVDISLGKQYDILFQERLSADYDINSNFSTKDAEKAIEFAQLFLAFTNKYFNLN